MEPDDVRRIAFVTRRFYELQGLTAACMGAGLLAGFTLWQYGPLPADPITQMLLGCMAALGPAVYFPRRYRETYGEVAPGSFAARLPRLLILVQIGGMVDVWSGGRFGPSAAAIALTCDSVAVLVHDFRWRPYYLVGVAAGVAGAVISASVAAAPGPSGPGFDLNTAPAYLFSYSLVGLALVVVGVLDHRLLSVSLANGQASRLGTPTNEHAARVRAMRSAPWMWFAGWTAVAVTFQLVKWGWPSKFYSLLMLLFSATSLGSFGLLLHSSIQRVRGLHRVTWPPIAADVVAPVAIAVAVILDTFIPYGRPSLLALAIAGACLRIAIRDWPLRAYYLVGFVAALVSAIQHATAYSDADRLRWFTMSLLLVSVSLLIEGLLDYRLSRGLRVNRTSTGETHADAV